MATNIVIFGVTHSGKSTMCGYLWSLMPGNFKKAEDINESLKNSLGPEYDTSSYYRYLVDDSKDEVVREMNFHGTTKKTHFRKIEIENMEITVIDSPGHSNLYKEINRGMFYADLGVFFIETHSILDKEYLKKEAYNEMLRVLRLWAMFKKSIIVVLSKSDLLSEDFDTEDYYNVCVVMNELCSLKYDYAKIVPISINVNEKYSKNILASDKKFQWYHKKSFTELLKEEVDQLEEEFESNLLFYVDREYFNKDKGIGKTWRIKIISGKIMIGDTIILSPVFIGVMENDADNLSITDRVPSTVTATITSIHYEISKGEKPETINSAGEGNIVGVSFGNIKKDGRGGISKREINTLSTTCGFSHKMDYKSSSKLRIKIEENKKVDEFCIDQQLNIMYFGSLVSVKVEEIDIKNNIIFVGVLSKSKYITLPADKGELLFDKIKIFSFDEFISAKIIDLI